MEAKNNWNKFSLLRLSGKTSRILLFFLIVLFLLHACHREKNTIAAGNTIVTAKRQVPITQLYYNATITPLRSQPVFSPIDARINSVFFQYGQSVQKGQKLFLLSSTQLIEDYRKAVADYLENKEAYENNILSFAGTKVLFHADIISKEDYANERAALDSKALSYYQAIYTLEKLLTKAGVKPNEIESLNVKNISEVSKILNKQFGQLSINSPVEGVALFPTDTDSSKDTTGKGGKIMIGDEVKADQLVLSIGDLTGFSVKFDVSEININQVKVGLPATVTGDAFPGITLKGKVSAISSQAKPATSGGTGGGLGLFEAAVQIPKVTPEQRKVIHVGMSCKVELDIPGQPQILIPVNAVTSKNGQNFVTLLDKNNKPHDTPIVTSTTTLDSVTVVSGVNDGDRILVPNKAAKPAPAAATSSDDEE